MKKTFFSLSFLALLGITLVIFIFPQFFVFEFFAHNTRKFSQRVSSVSQSIFSAQNLAMENQALRKQIAQYTFLEKKIADLEVQNDILQRQKDIIVPSDLQMIMAKIIDNQMYLFSGQYLLSVGSRDGVQKGDTVISENTFIGFIEDVYPYQSTVQLLTHNQTNLSVILEDGTLANIRGNVDANKLYLQNILREADVQTGSAVTLASETFHQDRIPLVIGTIESFIDVPEEPFLEAIVEPSIDYDMLDYAFVITQ